jgi:hypothetical protein
MSEDVARKLAYLCQEHRVTSEKFLEEFLEIHPSIRRNQLLEWLVGKRHPHGKSLVLLTEYWSRYINGIRPHWWKSTLDDFVSMHEIGREIVGSTGIDSILPSATSFSDAELSSLYGVYKTYRRSFNNNNAIAIEVIKFSPSEFSNKRVATRIFTYSSSAEAAGILVFNGYTFRQSQHLYLIAFGGTACRRQMRSAYLAKSELDNKEICRLGLMVGISERDQTPIATRLIITRNQDQGLLRYPEKVVGRCSIRDVPEVYQSLVREGRIDAAFPA